MNEPEMISEANPTLKKQIALVNKKMSQLDLQNKPKSINPVEHPKHACAYCGVHNPACVVLCKTTQKWFCNGDWKLPTGSHIITHLTRSGVKRLLQLHHESPHGDILLKCSKCGCANVFQLGFCPSKPEPTQLFCRTTCSEQNDVSSWKPIIEDQRFVTWLVEIPTDETVPVSADQISRLEELWKVNPQAGLKDLRAPTKDVTLVPVRLHYRNSRQYRETFVKLLLVEAEYDKEQKESQKLENVKFRWVKTPNEDHVAYFPLPDPKEGIEIHVRPGEEVIISRGGRPFCTGRVINSSGETNEEIGVEIKNISTEPPDSADFTIQFKWKSIPYARMVTAIENVSKKRIDLFPPCVFYRLLGQDMEDVTLDCDLPINFSVPGLPKLNPSQTLAVQTVVQRRLSLIQGPPGTGKTTTSAAIVYHLSKIYQKPVLAVAPSNIAADQLCEQIGKTGLMITRMYSRAREGLPSSIPSRLMLHEQICKQDGYNELRCLKIRKKKLGVLKKTDGERFRTLLWELENKVLSAADVICCTCITAGDLRLKSFKFHSILIDEAAQAIEPECLVPITLGCRQLVLVGDHCQLGPVIRCQRTTKAGLTQSLFEHFVRLGIKPIQLRIQYRMHPTLSQFPNQAFYDGTLQDGVTASDRCRQPDFPWPNPTIPMFFYRVTGEEELAANGLSRLNRMEASIVSELVAKMLSIGIQAKSIGVITPYEGQRAHILHELRYRQLLTSKQLNKSLEIANVDGFQGREKDYIILSCVRSNQKNAMGFLSDPCRLNVAITRARYGLIIVGNPKTLCSHGAWNAMLHFYQDRKLLVEGPLDNLRDHVMQCKRPKKTFRFKQCEYYRD